MRTLVTLAYSAGNVSAQVSQTARATWVGLTACQSGYWMERPPSPTETPLGASP
jgi:hypothetical protein